MRSNPAFSLAQAREWIERASVSTDLAKSFNVRELSTDTIRKLATLRAQSRLALADLISVLVEHGERAARDQIEKDKATLLHRAGTDQPRPDANFDDPEERRLARMLIAFTTRPGFVRGERRWRMKLKAIGGRS
jgi:hypothetical protein